MSGLIIALWIAAPTVDGWQGTGQPRARETRGLAQLADFVPRTVARDLYGGIEPGSQPTSGYFQARRLGERWWLIDPAGGRYLHVAVNSVAPGVTDDNQARFAARFDSPDAWREGTLDLLLGAGFNGLGCWSDHEMLNGGARRLAYTPRWNFMATYARRRGELSPGYGHGRYPNDCIPVFDGEFAAFCDEHARQLAATADDPWLLGHFSDNELPFPRDLLDKALACEPDDPTRRAATAWLAEHGAAAPTDALREAWRAHVLDRYLTAVGGAIRKYDPNHLYLGPRFYANEKGSQPFFEVAGRHLDVIAVNCYGTWNPRDAARRWADWSGRPVIPSEWYAKGADSGLRNEAGAGFTVRTQADRGRFYQHFALSLLESRAAVGWHWFKYRDDAEPNHVRARTDSNKGLVNRDWEPHEPLREAMAELNAQAYALAEYFD